ncbi:hypothetical protein [Microseira sp. BLCC-F43]|jgi:hypothetical protein|uniref:hypothetical protein n=1 Tax=Microseira sp. BLCC-F43 TaxID=3153602 RepID=UPI0035BA9793
MIDCQKALRAGINAAARPLRVPLLQTAINRISNRYSYEPRDISENYMKIY